MGRAAARARGRLGGRGPAKLSPEQTRLARARYKAQDVTVAEIARALGVRGPGLYWRWDRNTSERGHGASDLLAASA